MLQRFFSHDYRKAGHRLMEEISIGDARDIIHTNKASLEISRLPDSLLLQIFSYLEANDVVKTAHVCHRWRAVAYDESLWRKLVYMKWKVKGKLAPHRFLWRHEYQRLCERVPNVLSETLTAHTDEVLHVSFSHRGHLFSTTSKDCTIKVWNVGFPTTLKYSHDFRAHFQWDFTQFSCFSATDTMLLVSSVKTAEHDRRGYVAVLSITHDFQLLQVVAMDPSQLFGTWLDPTTFLGGSLEVSLDRFITSVQIQAFQVQDLPLNSKVDVDPENLGRTLFTFCSDNASLIKFLTVVNAPCTNDACTRYQTLSCDTKQISNSVYLDNDAWCASPDSSCLAECVMFCEQDYNNGMSGEGDVCVATCDIETDEEDSVSPMRLCLCCKKEISKETSRQSRKRDVLNIRSNGEGRFLKTLQKRDQDIPEHYQNKRKDSGDYMTDLRVLDEKRRSSSKHSLDKYHTERSEQCMDCNMEVLDDDAILSSLSCNYYDETPPSDYTECGLQDGCHHVCPKSLIYVTGEFAVALHQLKFKSISVNLTPSSQSGDAFGDFGNVESHMVVNYSNQLIEMQQVRKADPSDHMIDLNGHITGLTLSKDHRYLFVNCRPWVGTVDRSDPWETPDLSSEIEVRMIDLSTMEVSADLYVGHKGLSPSTMCCFIFLDTSQDFVGSGSEDSKAYIWERHYHCIVSKLPHGPGVVNAVGFCPGNQEYLVTVSDDNTIRIWRSYHSMRSNIGI